MTLRSLRTLSAVLGILFFCDPLRAADLVVTVSPNPVQASTPAKITATLRVAREPGCSSVAFDFGDGTRANVTLDSRGFVATHSWDRPGAYVVKAVLGPAMAAGQSPCARPASGRAEVNVTSRIPALQFRAQKVDVVKTPTPGCGGPYPTPPCPPPPSQPIRIEFVPPSPAPNTLVVVQLSLIGSRPRVYVDYGDGTKGFQTLGGGQTQAAFYHSYASSGTYNVRAWAADAGGQPIFQYPSPGTATLTVP